MRTSRILVVRMGGYLKAIFPDRQAPDRHESIFGRDERELIGRMRFRGILEPLPYPVGRKRR